MRKFILILLLAALCATSCEKEEPTRWDTAWDAPLAFGSLSLTDLVEDSMLSADGQGALSIHFRENILDVSLDSLFDIPADTLEKLWSIPIGVQVSPNQTIFQQDDEFVFPTEDATLTQATLSRGEINLRVENTFGYEILLQYRAPNALLKGQSLEIETIVPPMENGNPGVLELTRNIGGYELDLTGADGNQFNTLETSFTIRTPDNGIEVQVSPGNQIKLSLIYTNLGIGFARGYFNSTSVNFNNESSAFNTLEELEGATLDLASSSAILVFRNGFGVDMQAYLSELRSENSISLGSTSLNAPFIDAPINLSRASNLGDGILVPGEKRYIIDDQNTNLTSFIETLGDSIHFSGLVNLNPLGNISNFNDFVSEDSRLTAELDLNIPLELSLTNLALRDTFDITDLKDQAEEAYGDLYLHCVNSLPVTLNLQLSALDHQGMVILDLNQYLTNGQDGTISGQPQQFETPFTSLLKFQLDAEAIDLLRNAEQIMVLATFNTVQAPERVVFEVDQKLEFLLSTHLNLPISVK